MLGLLALVLLTVLLFYKVWMHRETIGGYDDEGTVVESVFPRGHEAVNEPFSGVHSRVANFSSPLI
jgi:hypothetical protein